MHVSRYYEASSGDDSSSSSSDDDDDDDDVMYEHALVTTPSAAMDVTGPAGPEYPVRVALVHPRDELEKLTGNDYDAFRKVVGQLPPVAIARLCQTNRFMHRTVSVSGWADPAAHRAALDLDIRAARLALHPCVWDRLTTRLRAKRRNFDLRWKEGWNARYIFLHKWFRGGYTLHELNKQAKRLVAEQAVRDEAPDLWPEGTPRPGLTKPHYGRDAFG